MSNQLGSKKRYHNGVFHYHIVRNVRTETPLLEQRLRRRMYNVYLSSPEWENKRQERFMLDDYQCVKCSSTARLCCHHLTYDNFTNEPTVDLMTLCSTCHAKIHSIAKTP